MAKHVCLKTLLLLLLGISFSLSADCPCDQDQDSEEECCNEADERRREKIRRLIAEQDEDRPGDLDWDVTWPSRREDSFLDSLRGKAPY